MKNLLNEIIQNKKTEVISKKNKKPFFTERELFSKKKSISLVKMLEKPGTNIIAEFKRKSPSGFLLSKKVDPEECILSYSQNGAAGISVLTDYYYFGGTINDIKLASEKLQLPVLRKEFIVDEYQVFESKATGADVILLIAAVLTPEKVKQFAARAKELSMEVLLEIRTKKELNYYYNSNIDIIGVNNRNLDTLKTTLDISFELIDKIPKSVRKISESGINNERQIKELRNAGYDGFLIGHSLLSQSDPGVALKELIQSSNSLVYEN